MRENSVKCKLPSVSRAAKVEAGGFNRTDNEVRMNSVKCKV